jgi:two-component system, cell cycle response regulator DivK
VTHATPLALLVDPDRDTREMYAEYFERHQWRTQTARDGADALAQIVRGQPTVVITELRLPHFDGWRLVSVLKGHPSTSAIPVIVVTADVIGGSVEHARTAGADLVLAKPCLPESLLSAASDVVAAGAAATAAEPPGRTTARRAHAARATDATPAAPPRLSCPQCDRELRFDRSYFGGVNVHKEQWDYFTCPGGCGRFCYRRRTRKMRRVG